MNELTLGESAEYLAEMGYLVFPLVPGKKTPLIEGWTEKATDDEETVRAWWQKTPNANIGICTTGLLVVDIDVKNGIPFWFKRHQQKLENATSTIARTWSGGYHYYFNDPSGFLKNTVGSNGGISEGIDTRAWHGYVVAPPSVVDGKPYAWKHINFEERKELFDVPTFVLEDLRKGEATQKKKVQLEGGAFSETVDDGVRELTLYKLAVELRGLGLVYDEMVEALMKFNERRCKPPMDRKTVETKAKSAMKLEPHQCAEFLLSESEKQITVVIDSRRVDADGNELVPKGSLASLGVSQKTEIEVIEEETDETNPEGTSAPTIKESLLTCPGVIQKTIEYTLTHAQRPNQTLAFGGALSLASVLFGRKVRYKTVTPNLYVMNVAPSAYGKSAPMTTNSNILNALGEDRMFYEEIGSTAGLQDLIKDSPSFLFQVDEISFLLRQISNPNNANPAFKDLPTMLNKIYDLGLKHYYIRKLSGKEPFRVEQPNFVLFGSTTPDNFYPNIGEEVLGEGLVSRWLVLDTRERNKIKLEKDQDWLLPPTSLVMMWSIWSELKWKLRGARLHEELDDNSGTVNLFDGITDHFEQLATNFESKGDKIASVINNRMPVLTKKLALICACSRLTMQALEVEPDKRNEMEVVIRMSDIVWAFEFTQAVSKQMIWNFKTNYSANDNEKKLNKLLRILREKGGAVPHSILSNNSHLLKNEFNLCVETLVQRNRIEVRKAGRGLVYHLK